MKWTVELKKVRVECKLNLTADHWQLYNLEGRENERELVAEKLNRAVEAKLADGDIAGVVSVLYPFKEFGLSHLSHLSLKNKILLSTVSNVGYGNVYPSIPLKHKYCFWKYTLADSE